MYAYRVASPLLALPCMWCPMNGIAETRGLRALPVGEMLMIPFNTPDRAALGIHPLRAASILMAVRREAETGGLTAKQRRSGMVSPLKSFQVERLPEGVRVTRGPDRRPGLALVSNVCPNCGQRVTRNYVGKA